MSKKTYYVLDDLENRGVVVRAEGRSQQRYIPDRGWVESGILMKYFNDESPCYDLYNIVTEEEAIEMINKK